MKLPVEIRGADEQEAAGGDDRSAVVVAAGVRQPFRGQLREFAEGNLPADRPGVEIDGAERAPWRGNRRVSVGIAEQRLAVASILQPGWIAGHAGVACLVTAGDQEFDKVADVAPAHVGISRHAAGAFADDPCDVVARHPIADADERRRLRRTTAILAMAGRALAVVERGVVVRDQPDDPGHLVRVHVQERRLRIERGPAPFGAAVDAGKDDRAVERRRREEPLAHAAELRQHGGVRLGRARGYHRFGQFLARERRRLERVRLPLRQQLAVDRRRRHFSIANREQRPAGPALEHVHVAVFRHLGDCFNLAPRAGDGDEVRGSGEVPVPHVVPDALKVPDAAPGPGVEREHTVGEQVVSVPGHTVEVEGRRSGGGKHHRVLRIDSDAGPGIGAPGNRVGVLRPRLVAELARLRNGVKDPADFPAVDVEGTDVSGRSGHRLRDGAAHDEQIFEDDAGRAGADG